MVGSGTILGVAGRAFVVVRRADDLVDFGREVLGVGVLGALEEVAALTDFGLVDLVDFLAAIF